jgi:type I restriction enzyme S subunit
MSDWTERPISELCSQIVDCVNKTAPVVDEATPYKMIRTTNVKHGRIDLKNVRYVDHETYRRWTRRGAPAGGDIILTREAPLGEVGLLRDAPGVFLGQRLVMYRADPERVDRNFLFHAMRGPDVQAQIKALGSGATVEHMRVPDCGKLVLACPSLPEQKSIGCLLAAFDEIIVINERQIELLEDLAQSLYGEWFARHRFPGYEHSPLVDSELGMIPATWEVRRLGDVCALVRAGGTPSRSETANWEDGTIPWFKTGELQDRPLTYSAENVSSYARVRLFEPPTILMAIYGSPTVGRLGWLTRVSSCNQAALALRAHHPDIEQDWLWYQLKALRAHFNAIAQGAAQQNIGKHKVVETRILVPPPDILSAFAKQVSPIRKLWHELTTTNEVLAATRDLLLPRLVTGRLDISDLDLGDLLPAEAT